MVVTGEMVRGFRGFGWMDGSAEERSWKNDEAVLDSVGSRGFSRLLNAKVACG